MSNFGRKVPETQWLNWVERMLHGEHLEEEMQNAGVFPNANTPLPPTSATIHLLADELGYGTLDRTFIALCGVSWRAQESTGEHKYFLAGDYQWHRHINCEACRKQMGNGRD